MNASCMKKNCARIHFCKEILPFSERPAVS